MPGLFFRKVIKGSRIQGFKCNYKEQMRTFDVIRLGCSFRLSSSGLGSPGRYTLHKYRFELRNRNRDT
jgi:hypothetical protein